MCSLALLQLSTLIRKDLIIRRRTWFSTLLELVVPILIVYITCHVVQETLPKEKKSHVGKKKDPSVLIGRRRIVLKYFPSRALFTPNSPDIDALVKFLTRTIKEDYHEETDFINVPSEDDMVPNTSLPIMDRYDYIGLIFDPTEPTLSFRIRVNFMSVIISEEEVDTDLIYPWHRFIIFHWVITSSELNDPVTSDHIQHSPWYDTFESATPNPIIPGGVLGSVLKKAVKVPLGLGNLVVLAVAVKRIVTEKQRGSKELLRMMGVADCTFWLEQFINYLPFFLIQAPIMTSLIFNVFGERLLENVPFLLFMSMTLILFISNLLMSFVITNVTTKPILAQMAVMIAVIYGVLRVLETKSNIFGMFFFPIAYFGTWLDISVDKSKKSEYSSYIHFLFIPFWILYILMLLYLDAVCPWQPGTTKSFYFLFKRGQKHTDLSSMKYKIDCDPKLVEESSGEASIICNQLKKVFTLVGGRKLAVENLSMKINKNQITILLGHNGAGKTTLMNMITGFISPTSGQVYVNGFDVQKNSPAARRSLALCPQHECLYENLTVEENFRLCCDLRASDRKIITITLNCLHLDGKSTTLASKLSGGMRRRVQLGMALVTDSDTLILDEPTSGLDPETRRTVWDYLILLREKKTILITTHFMEEAEALADQIIVMSAGRIKCIGSQIFLKTRLGAGYTVRMEKKSFNQDLTKPLIEKFYPKASIANDTSEEITFALNVDEEEEKSDNFLDNIAALCDSLEEKKEELGISSFTITTATLEDVFMKIAVDEGLVEEDRVTFSQVKDTTLVELQDLFNSDPQKRHSSSFCQRYYGLLCKRWNIFRRDYRYFIYSSLVPIAVVILAMNTLTYTLIPRQTLTKKNNTNREVSPNYYTQNSSSRIKIVFSGSPNSSLSECFSLINNQYDLDTIITNVTIYEYLDLIGQNRSVIDGTYLFGIQDQGSTEDITLFGSNYYLASKAIVVNNYLNILRCVATGETNLIQARDHRFPNKPIYMLFIYESISRRIYFLLLLPIPIAFILACIYTFPATENQVKAELIQRMAGLGDFSYWISNFTFDSVHYFIINLIILAVLVSYSSEILFTPEIIATHFLLFIVSGFSGISFVYLLTFTKIESGSGFNILVICFALFGILFSLIIMVVRNIEFLEAADAYTDFFINTFKVILTFRAFPPIGLISGLDLIYRVAIIMYACERISDLFVDELNSESGKLDPYIIEYCLNGTKPDYPLLVWPELAHISIFGLVSIFLIVVFAKISHRLSKCVTCFTSLFSGRHKKHPESEDENVMKEKEVTEILVKTRTLSQEALVAHKLTKDYFSCCCRRSRAVDDISFTVHKKECFGLLGVNGAGKTTTFSMLTGDTPITKGEAYIGELNVTRNLTKYREKVSYCPQQNALLDLLTPEETLKLFARLKGIPENEIPKNVDFIIFSTDLTKFRKTLNCNLSGGNKRKLGLAIATVEGPAAMFLDEPTTGVDPASRRKIWATLVGLRESGRSSIVLTSHSMDECEALCNRIAIMASGQIKCLGSSTHLKNKYGQGYTLIVKLKMEADFPLLQESIQEIFPSAKLQDQHGTTVQFHLTDPGLRWGDMLRSMKQVKAKLPIVNFYINGTSIEQIFLSFAHKDVSQNDGKISDN